MKTPNVQLGCCVLQLLSLCSDGRGGTEASLLQFLVSLSKTKLASHQSTPALIITGFWQF